MSTLLDDIARETNGKSFKTYKYGFDGIEVPRFDYDDHKHQITWKKYGETERLTKPKDIKNMADRYLTEPPLFAYFLDGSRKTYKVDDMAYRNQIYPIIAGQVGVGCCTRINMEMQPLYCGDDPMFERHLVISLPKIAKANDWDDDELAFEHLRKKINARTEMLAKGINFAKILSYSTKVEIVDKIENKGIATIQNYMVEREKYMVAELMKRGRLLPDRFLIKDGSLEYQVHGITNRTELARFRNNYQFVVGVSKSFNPENCVDKNGRNNSNLIAQLLLYHRTPVNMYHSDRIGDMNFAVWFVRIRDAVNTLNAFDGILKLEKIGIPMIVHYVRRKKKRPMPPVVPWSAWGETVHQSRAQADRMHRAMAQGIRFGRVKNGVAKARGSSGEVYYTSLGGCTCQDFAKRGKPCKHMYALAIKTAGFDPAPYMWFLD